MSVIIIIVVFCFGTSSSKECTTAPFKMWSLGEGAYYVINLMFSWIYYKMLNRTNRECTKFLLVNCALNVFHSCWLIYGNVIFWPNYATCGKEMVDQGSNISWIMGFLIVLGYITICKCCTVGLVFICFAPTIIRAFRNQRDPTAQW